MTKTIQEIDIGNLALEDYNLHLADCVILTHDNKILMQKRPDNWRTHPGVVNIFGGHVDDGETIMQGLTRELKEKLGAEVKEKDVTFVGTITEEEANHTEAVHVHFWHDKAGTITGCYEAESIHFETVEEAISHSKIMDYAAWSLKECQKKGLL